MNAPLDEQYFEWLYSQIGSVKLKNPSKTHWSMLRQFYQKEFVWLIANDDNRVEDGRDLRYEFLTDYLKLEHHQIDKNWLELECSVLEMMIALSRRLAFEAEGEPRGWFWQMVQNLDLARCNDKVYNEIYQKDIDDILERLIWRQYASDGRGGLFPLEHAVEDQTDIEIWYQLSAYLLERY